MVIEIRSTPSLAALIEAMLDAAIERAQREVSQKRGWPLDRDFGRHPAPPVSAPLPTPPPTSSLSPPTAPTRRRRVDDHPLAAAAAVARACVPACEAGRVRGATSEHGRGGGRDEDVRAAHARAPCSRETSRAQGPIGLDRPPRVVTFKGLLDAGWTRLRCRRC